MPPNGARCFPRGTQARGSQSALWPNGVAAGGLKSLGVAFVQDCVGLRRIRCAVRAASPLGIATGCTRVRPSVPAAVRISRAGRTCLVVCSKYFKCWAVWWRLGALPVDTSGLRSGVRDLTHHGVVHAQSFAPRGWLPAGPCGGQNRARGGVEVAPVGGEFWREAVWRGALAGSGLAGSFGWITDVAVAAGEH